ncbi:hypothetical protein AB205_0020310, partial [Aquarana catesbeiana]
EWELEIAYRQLLDSAQQQGGAPFAWDYQEIPVDNSEILAEVSAVENLDIAIPKAEVLTTRQSSDNLCPALIASSGFHGHEIVNFYPQTPVAETGDLIDFSAAEEQPDEPPAEELVSGPNFSVLCPAPTAVSVELQGTSPAEVLVTRQRVQDLCPTPVAVPQAHGEKVAITSQQPDEGMEKEAASSPPQWQLHSLGGEEFRLLPQRLAKADDVESPAEVLATGQKMQGGEAAIYPPQQGFVHLGDNTSERKFQQQTAPQNDDTNPAEVLATGQSATNLCPAPATTTEFQGAGAVGLPPNS